MKVRLYDDIFMSIEEIYEKIGCKENNNNNFNGISEIENNLIITLNNFRMNPTLFYGKNVKLFGRRLFNTKS